MVTKLMDVFAAWVFRNAPVREKFPRHLLISKDGEILTAYLPWGEMVCYPEVVEPGIGVGH